MIDRRAFLKGSVGAGGALLLPGCTRARGNRQTRPTGDGQRTDAATSGEGGRPTVRIPGGPFGFPSPFAYNGGPGYWRMSFIYDTLLWADASGSLLAWLASDYESSGDGLTYTFHLREDVRWQDGEPLTAADVAFTIDYFKRQPFLPPLVVAQPHGVAGAKAVDEHTVEVRLEAPLVTFPQQVAAAVPIIPRHVWSEVENPVEAQDVALLVGSGPYRLKSFSREQGSYLYVANDDFFLGAPYVQRIEMVPVGDEVTALLAGDVDGAAPPVQAIGPQALQPFQDDDRFTLIEQESSFAFPLYWNLQRGGALADVRVRQAMAHAINREELVQRVAGGNGTPGNPGFLPPDHPFHVAVEQYAFDPESANRLLDEAGYTRSGGESRQTPDGQPLRFALTVGQPSPPALTDVLVANLAEVGIEIEPVLVDIPRMFESKIRGDYELLITIYPGPSGPGLAGDPDYLRAIYSSEAVGFHATQGYSNEQVDQLAARQVVTADEGERRTMLEQLQELFAAEVPVLPLYYSTIFFAYRPDVFDAWYYTPDGGFGPGIPTTYNKHAFTTGRQDGLKVRTPRSS